MNKSILILVFILLSSLLSNCKEEEVLNHIDVNLFTGTWEVVESNNPERGCIYEITTSPDLSVNMYDDGYHGQIKTYYLTATGNPLYDKEYNWSIRFMENHQPLLDLTLKGGIDSEDPWAGNYYYKVTKLSNSVMWWQANTNGDNATIKFHRRTNLKINWQWQEILNK